MKFYRYVLAVLFAGIIITVYGQGADYVATVKAACNKTDNTNSLILVKFTTDNGTELSGYFKDNELVKIRSVAAFPDGRYEDEYYYMNGQMAYVYEVEKHFVLDPESGGKTDQLNVAFSGNYYLMSGKIVLENKVGFQKDIKRTTAAVFLKDSKKYAELIRSHKQ